MNAYFLPLSTQEIRILPENQLKDCNYFQSPSKSPKPLAESKSSTCLLSSPELEKRLVYINNHLKNPLASQSLFKNYLDDIIKAKISGSSTKDLLSFYKIRTEQDAPELYPRSNQLIFFSDFESGNLQKAFLHEKNEYVLMIHPDHGNPKYSHWFFFEVLAKVKETFRFHIVNINKKDVSLEKGMKIVVREAGEWRRGGDNIVFQESLNFSSYFNAEGYFTLSFSHTFKENNWVGFAYSYPYTHSQLTDWLRVLKHVHHDILTVTPLCKTLNNHTCDLVTITSDIALYNELKKNQISEKKAVIIMGRVHPGESPSSFIVQGLINFLISKSFDAKMLRKKFVFKIIPMVNPDGVRYGNTRCSLLGIDLNRRWLEANEILHPEIFFAKELVREVKQMHDLVMYCDIHSHAKKQNVFMYGCRTQNPDKGCKKQNLVAKMIPILLAKKNVNFSYPDSHFKMDKDKESTGRIVMYKEFGVLNSYTLETSFYGRESGEQFSISDWETVGSDLAQLCSCLVSPVSIKGSLRVALEWYKKSKVPKKKPNKNKIKNKKMRVFKVSTEIEPLDSEDSDNEKLPNIASPHPKVTKLDIVKNSKKSKGLSAGKKIGHGRSQRNLKTSLDCVTGRKILESFPSIELSEKKKSPLQTKLSMASLKIKENTEKLPLIKYII